MIYNFIILVITLYFISYLTTFLFDFNLIDMLKSEVNKTIRNIKK